jgi:adiponectin receptor
MRKETTYISLLRRRRHTTSYRDCMLSIVHLHSETINIWSHLFGTLWFCTSATRFAGTATSLSSTSAATILIFLTANTFCFACSTLYHIFADHAEADSWLRLDHLGIVCAIWASSISFVALSICCHPGEQYVYIGSVTAAAAVCSYQLVGIFQHSCSERRSRISTYVILGSHQCIGRHYLRNSSVGHGDRSEIWCTRCESPHYAHPRRGRSIVL